jgi:uncharacterized cupredoxin-like copper-binding protein
MQPMRTAIAAFVIVGAVAACSSTGAAPSAPSALATVAAASPSAAPTAVPSPSPSAAASATAVPSSVAAKQTISLYEWKVIAPTTLKAGTTTFTISNFGAVPHELLVFKSSLAPAAYPTDPAGNIKEEGAGVKLLSDGDNIDPAGSQVRAIDLAPGTYLFVCNIAGHFKQGMFTTVTVTP